MDCPLAMFVQFASVARFSSGSCDTLPIKTPLREFMVTPKFARFGINAIMIVFLSFVITLCHMAVSN
jgi:hypothetical protein